MKNSNKESQPFLFRTILLCFSLSIVLSMSVGCKKEQQAAPPAPTVEVVSVAQKDVPIFKGSVTEEPHGAGPYDSMPIGETGNIPTAAAIANAVEDACGVRITSLPITAEKIHAALHGSK